ncbi:hypothetical protein DMUE_1400 [Dictyocoela muelleri]|nr:hypothetical protein DMUE_1400 [Dictyocoela muelleri]
MLPKYQIERMAFYFRQILIRYLKPRFIDKYKHDKAFKKMVTFCYFLSFVPKDKIEYEFNKIFQKYKDIDLAFYEFINFFYENFIINKRKNKVSNFWSANDRVILGLMYTTNSCEAYHRYLNSKLTKKDSQLVKIIDILKK